MKKILSVLLLVYCSFGAGLKEYEKACDNNDFAVCSDIGVFYATGQGGVKKDLNKAFKYYTKACDNDNAVACTNMADLYLDVYYGNNVRDLKKAREYFQKACDLNDGLACRNLGQMAQNVFFTNDGKISLKELKADVNKAREYFQKACDLDTETDHGGGCFLLSILEYEKGDKMAAMKLQAKACESALNDACVALGNTYKEFKKDSAKLREGLSADELEKLCNDDNYEACGNLGIIYSTDEKLKDIKKANVSLRKACDAFDGHSCWVLGANLEESCSPDDNKGCQKVLGLYKTACALGSQLGCKYAMSIESGMPWMRF